MDCQHDFNGRLGGPCLRCGKTARQLAHPDEDDGEEAVATILEKARREVSHVVAAERTGERISVDTINMRIY